MRKENNSMATTVPERHVHMSGIDALLETTISQHGFWLVNNKEHIIETLESMIRIYGQRDAAKLLNNIDHQIVKEIYAIIEQARERAKQEGDK